MTVLINATPNQKYTGNGSTVAFSFPYRFLQNDDGTNQLAVHLSTAETIPLVEGTDYSVTGAGKAAGGTVTFVTPPATGVIISITRNVPITQSKDYTGGGDFPAEAYEQGLDKITMALQQISEKVNRSVSVDILSSDSPDMLINKVETLYDDIANINTVSSNLAAINTNADNITAIQTAATNAQTAQTAATTATTKAGEASASATNAAASEALAEEYAAIAKPQSDWEQTDTTANDYIKNKPALSTVATSGSYSDLSDTPDLDLKADEATVIHKTDYATATIAGIVKCSSDTAAPTPGRVICTYPGLTTDTTYVGDVAGINVGASGTLNLPPGGTWFVFHFGAAGGINAVTDVKILAGGTTVTSPQGYIYGFVWRIA